MEFRPIETAPKNGNCFDAWSDDGERYAKCRYMKFRGELGLGWWRDVSFDKEGEWVRLNATMFKYWTPIPKAPNMELTRLVEGQSGEAKRNES